LKFLRTEEVKHITFKAWILVVAVVLISGAFLFLRGPETPVLAGASDIPDNYYFALKPADVDSPVELIRFATSVRPDTSGLSISERVAYFEWYLKNRGFDVSFVYSDNFRNQGYEHVWLLVKNQQGESMYVEPSSTEMDADSICPTTPEYKSYQKQFGDIYELSRNTNGTDEYAWWKTASGRELFDNNVMLLKKEQL
jgi:hypothetical protein